MTDNIEMAASCLVVTGVCFCGVARQRCDADLHVVLRLQLSEAVPPFYHVRAWYV
jgi:hypothetical protein